MWGIAQGKFRCAKDGTVLPGSSQRRRLLCRPGDAPLGNDALSCKLALLGVYGFKGEVARQNMPYRRCFNLVDDQNTGAGRGQIVTWRRHSAHQHALGFGRGDLVADPLTRHFALELREGQQTLSVRRPIDEVVLNGCVTLTN